MKLDSLEKSRFWFYHCNGELISYRLFARPLISAKDDEKSIIVAHYPASFEIRVSSDGNYQRLLSVLQDDANYDNFGRSIK
ncbi:MAG TPA: hypothetical protein VFE98_04300 [Candidatus Bathyarchaeia archaeon]|nr:hypothetical protein [Candidatus Bathyarchaeia archaeon]